jgi:hypothetical protein
MTNSALANAATSDAAPTASVPTSPRSLGIEKKAVRKLLARAIEVDVKPKHLFPCLHCHLQPSFDGRKFRHYILVGGRSGTEWTVTRLIWHVLKGPIPEGLMVLHTCDDSECIRLEHLFLGTAQDMMAKVRGRYDPEVGHRRKEQTAQLIRPLLAQGLDRHAIAKRLGISPSTVWNYINGPYRDYLSIPSRD